MKDSSRTQRLLLVIGLALSCVVCICAFLAVRDLSNLFGQFGAEPPWQLDWVLRIYPGFLVLPVFVVLTWVFWPRRERRGLAALVVGIAVSVAVPLVFFAVIYMPHHRYPSGTGPAIENQARSSV